MSCEKTTQVVNESDSEPEKEKINFLLAGGSVIALLSIVIYAAIDPALMNAHMGSVKMFIARYFGWWYIGLDAVFCLPIFIIPFTKYGSLKLGKPDDKPEYSIFSWMTMLICCSFAVSVVVWAVAEPVYHWMQPPLGAEAGTMDALRQSFQITIMHTGLGGFGIFAVAGACIGLPAFRCGLPINYSTAFYGLMGDKAYSKVPSTIFELIAMVVNFLGISTSIGLGLISLRFGINYLFGIHLDTTRMIFVTCLIGLGFCWSVWRGLDSGIKTLSHVNAYIAIAVFCYVLFLGPTRHILDWMIQIPGEYFGNLIYLSLYTDATEQAFDGQWMGWWKVFYWGWWFSFVPFVGGFLARISKGRSLREMLLVCTFVPVFTCIVWYTTFGVSAVYTEMAGNVSLWAEIQKDIGAGFYVMVSQWPLGYLFSIVTMFMLFVFMITSADSAAFFCSMQLTNGSAEPCRLVRMIAGFSIVILAVTLILVGGLKACQTAAVVGGLPISFLMALMLISFWKYLHEEGERLGFKKYF
ncbi:glycine betaine transporter [Desulfuromusa kysingii]|uniref:Glycine betaine transporter n=1 Tax=Desulfuromusa kysingii TaxID=37625 RepID=A0A1H4C726_9BACT|nr:BCCT family transporter [Desulfuromusa kysingii]SEA56149.1 glycine betaine transporter [Desulfuromusa kysingii]